MPYRDERDGLRTRIDDLESDLQNANQDLAELRGEVVSEEVQTEEKKSRFVGAATRMGATRHLDFEFAPEAYEEIAVLLNERLGATSSQVGRSLTCGGVIRGAAFEFKITPDGGGTQLTVKLDHGGSGHLLVGAVSAIASLAGFAALVAIAKATGLPPAHATWMVPAALAGMGGPAWWATRKLFQNRVERPAREALLGVMAAVVEIAERHADPPAVKVQVSGDEVAEEVAEEVAQRA